MENYKKEENYTTILQHGESMRGYLRLGDVAWFECNISYNNSIDRENTGIQLIRVALGN